jgi:23S rRNA (guanosine2251-2'-O)-methyltransferase
MKKISLDELGRISLDDFRQSEKSSMVIVLDNIRSQHNIGSVFRTSDAFRIEKIYLCGISATPPNREIQKTALGATESVAWEYFEKTSLAIDELKKLGYVIISIEQVEGSTSLNKFIPEKNKKYALVFGNEVKGVEQGIVDLSDLCLEIPQFGTKHSFNVSVTAGIVMWDLFNKMKSE